MLPKSGAKRDELRDAIAQVVTAAERADEIVMCMRNGNEEIELAKSAIMKQRRGGPAGVRSDHGNGTTTERSTEMIETRVQKIHKRCNTDIVRGWCRGALVRLASHQDTQQRAPPQRKFLTHRKCQTSWRCQNSWNSPLCFGTCHCELGFGTLAEGCC